jgi:hypothetical protein
MAFEKEITKGSRPRAGKGEARRRAGWRGVPGLPRPHWISSLTWQGACRRVRKSHVPSGG